MLSKNSKINEEITKNPLIDEQQFWNCVSVLLRHYHVVNKKIFAGKVTGVYKIFHGITKFSDWHWPLDPHGDPDVKCCALGESKLRADLACGNKSALNCDGYAVFFKFMSKKMGDDSIDALGIIDFKAVSYRLRFKSAIVDDFTVSLSEHRVNVKMLTSRSDADVSKRWIQYVLQPKLINWCDCAIKVDDAAEQVFSLQLIDVELYYNLYKQFKQKYSRPALELWERAKESTNPSKFISEDLAIAAYLICLWRRTPVNKPVFADLGCGNGLLVYILNQEGYNGYGYDIRKRKLWSLYSGALKLIEQPIEPKTFVLPAEVNWIIGNHSDELSPWIPVLAATAGLHVNYFLLPCCAYEFSGAKFQRRNTSLSIYQDFLHYVHVISGKCGYKTMRDRLTIPSTKRMALVGIDRDYDPLNADAKLIEIWNYVNEELRQYSNATVDEIKLRDKVEPIRNCTRIDENIISELVLKIFHLLLSYIPNSSTWQCGRRLSMAEIVRYLSVQDLKHIKSECGGIKTLLRNNHEIFQFHGSDLIGIRKPIVRDINDGMQKVKRPQTVKKRLCFFKDNHPDGCPLTDDECTFIHTSDPKGNSTNMSELQASDEPVWMDMPYLTKILNKCTKNKLKEIIYFSKAPATTKCENYASAMHLINVEYTLKNHPETIQKISLIMKSRLENELMSKIEEDFNVFHREAQVYTVIMDEAYKLLHTIGDEIKFGPSAIYVDERIIVQENLKDKGYHIKDVKMGLDYPHCRMIIEKLAKFHAISMVLYKKNPDTFRHHLPSNISEHPSPLHDLYTNAIRTTIEHCKINPSLQSYVPKLEAFGEMIIPKMINVFSRNQADRFHVLNHGDVWVNNMMFCEDTNGHLKDVLFVDYQEGFYGSPGIDWNYFIFSSWQTEVFQNNFQELLELYHSTLSDILHKFNHPERIPTVEDIRKEIVNKGFHGLATATCLLPILINEHDHLADPVHFLVETDESAKNRRLIFSNPKFGERLKLFLPYFVQNGIL